MSVGFKRKDAIVKDDRAKAVKSDASLRLCRSRWPNDAAVVSLSTWLRLLFIMAFFEAAEVYLEV